MNLKNYITSLSFPHRGTCPQCSGVNSFSADVVAGNILYHCYRVSCKLKGRIPYACRIEDLRNVLGNMADPNAVSSNAHRAKQIFCNPLQNRSCFAFLKRTGVLRAYVEGRVGIGYDPKQTRCVFNIRDLQGNIQGATGRNLTRETPKWYIYERNNGCPGFVLSNSKEKEGLLIVEDMVSACVASEYINAAALLGTTIAPETIAHLLSFKKLYVALDPDALGKAIKIQQILNVYRPTFIVNLKNDIKYYTSEEIQDLVSNLP